MIQVRHAFFFSVLLVQQLNRHGLAYTQHASSTGTLAAQKKTLQLYRSRLSEVDVLFVPLIVVLWAMLPTGCGQASALDYPVQAFTMF